MYHQPTGCKIRCLADVFIGTFGEALNLCYDKKTWYHKVNSEFFTKQKDLYIFLLTVGKIKLIYLYGVLL